MKLRVAALGAAAIASLLVVACSRGDEAKSDEAASSTEVPPATAGADEATATGTTAEAPAAPGTTSGNAPSGDQTPPASGDRADSSTQAPDAPAPKP